MQASPGSALRAPLTTESIIDAAKQHLSDAQHSAVIQLEQSVVRGDVKTRKYAYTGNYPIIGETP